MSAEVLVDPRAERRGGFPQPTNCSSTLTWGARMIRDAVSRDLSEVNAGASVPDRDVESLARRESRWLLEAASVAAGREPLFVREPQLTSRVVAVFRSHVARRSRGEPLAYVLGEASFRGIDLAVTPDVLIPRSETEQLVELVLSSIPSLEEATLLDQGTGCGAIAIAVALDRPKLRVVAVDISEPALDLARRNSVRHGVETRVDVVRADLYPPDGRFDVIVANLPYLREDAALPRAVADWEPRGALRGGPTGSEIIRRSIALAGSRMTPRYRHNLFYEIGVDQAAEGAASFGNGFIMLPDLTGRSRFLVGTAKA